MFGDGGLLEIMVDAVENVTILSDKMRCMCGFRIATDKYKNIIQEMKYADNVTKEDRILNMIEKRRREKYELVKFENQQRKLMEERGLPYKNKYK